jgi:hypothetical protein
MHNMSQRLIKPGLSAADQTCMFGLIRSLGTTRDGGQIWPALGGAPDDDEGGDDPDDDKYTGGDDDKEDDESDEDEQDEDDKNNKKKSRDDDDDDEDDPRVARASRQAAKYRTKLREAEAKNAEMEKRLRAIEDKDKKPDEIASRDLVEARERTERLSGENHEMKLQIAFLTSNVVDWVDPEDALRLVDLSDVDVADDGTVDRKALRVALKDLAKRKPHLVKKPAKASGKADDDDEDDEEQDQRSPRRSAATMNGKRKGNQGNTDRAALEKKFPVLKTLSSR